MGVRNWLIEGVSGTGKTAVCHELRRRGFHAINADRDLAYRGDPRTGEPVDGSGPRDDAADSAAWRHAHHIWDIAKVKAVLADRREVASFFCGGSRNVHHVIDRFDGVFILDVDLATLIRRIDARPPDEFGASPDERELILRLHATKEDLPKHGTVIDATAPLERVVDAILLKCGLAFRYELGSDPNLIQ
jgi:thymidylate kinase